MVFHYIDKFMVSGCVYVCVALHVSIPSFTRNYEETQVPIDVQHCPDDLKSSSGLQMYIVWCYMSSHSR